MQRSPVVFLECQVFLFFGGEGGLVTAIFPAPVSQGAQCSQALWRSQQTADSKEQISSTVVYFMLIILWRFNIIFSVTCSCKTIRQYNTIRNSSFFLIFLLPLFYTDTFSQDSMSCDLMTSNLYYIYWNTGHIWHILSFWLPLFNINILFWNDKMQCSTLHPQEFKAWIRNPSLVILPSPACGLSDFARPQNSACANKGGRARKGAARSGRLDGAGF